MFKKHIFAVGAALVLCSTGALAEPFTFDPTGTAGASGNISGVGAFDQSPGNSLAINGGGILAPGRQITVLYQANLSTAQAASDSSNVFFNGQGGNFFTFVAGYGETVVNGTAQTAEFGFDSTNTTNFFKVYKTTSQGNNLTGAGFTSSTLIMSGHFLPDNYSSNYTRSGTGTTNFDNSGNGDQYSGFQSIIGSGATSLTAIIDALDGNYFPDLAAGTTFSFFNTSQVTPFNQVDPSQAFINLTGTASGTTAPSLGSQNGASNGANFQLQADANQSFVRAVPEPDSLLLMGLGLGLVGFLAKRRKQAA